MINSKVILRFDDYCERNKYLLRRIQGTATVDSLIRLIDIADLHANPREAKVGEVTDEIQETLRSNPQLFQFMSKGILLATGECSELERNRFELSFQDDRLEGVLDGGHNLLAIALFLVANAAGENAPKVLRSVKRWEHLSPVWREWRSEIEALRSKLNFLTPIEIIFPQPNASGQDDYQNAILDVARARNNNVQLTAETKAHQAGFYTSLQEALDPKISKQVEWKTNDGGRLKARDLIALSWIPLSLLDSETLDKYEFNPVSMYSSKNNCITAFNKLMEREEISAKEHGPIRALTHSGVKSALAIMRDIPRLYDDLYKEFPNAYNSTSSRFGGIDSVRIWEPKKATVKDPKYLRKPALTLFYQEECVYDYPDGFIMPLVWALRSLMENKDGEIVWRTDPNKFIHMHLNDTLKIYYSMIKMANWDPQKIGKAGGAYELLADNFANRLNN